MQRLILLEGPLLREHLALFGSIGNLLRFNTFTCNLTTIFAVQSSLGPWENWCPCTLGGGRRQPQFGVDSISASCIKFTHTHTHLENIPSHLHDPMLGSDPTYQAMGSQKLQEKEHILIPSGRLSWKLSHLPPLHYWHLAFIVSYSYLNRDSLEEHSPAATAHTIMLPPTVFIQPFCLTLAVEGDWKTLRHTMGLLLALLSSPLWIPSNRKL